MKNEKYMSSGGLAFTEEKDMKRLSKMAEKGWVLHSFAPLGYKLRKSNPRHVVYSLDYHDVAREDLEDYYDIFRAGGWQPVCSEGNMHIFSAPPGTKPIYTDGATRLEKYKRARKLLSKVTLILFAFTALCFLVNFLFIQDYTGLAGVIAYIVQTLAIALFLPSLMTWAAYEVRIRRMASDLKHE